jgi:hypothetical protein
MSRALAIVALSSALLGLGAVPAGAARLGPFCVSFTPAQTFAPTIDFPPLTLEVFVDSEPYGQVYLGTARTLEMRGIPLPPDSPSFVTLQVAGRFVRLSIVGTSFGTKPTFTMSGQLDLQATPPSGPVEVTGLIASATLLVPGHVGGLPGIMSLIPCT